MTSGSGAVAPATVVDRIGTPSAGRLRSRAWAARARAALVPLGLGSVVGTACAEPALWPLAAIAFCLLAALEQASVATALARRPALAGFVGTQVAGQWWVLHGVSTTGWQALPWQAGVFAIMLAGQTACFALCLALARRTFGERLPGLAWCLAWAGADALRQIGWTGDAYAVPGIAFIDAPGAAGWLPLVGLGGWTLIAAAAAWGVAAGVGAWRAGTVSRVRAGAPVAAVVAVAIAGRVLAGIEWTAPDGPAVAVVALQGGIDKRAEWTVAMRDHEQARLLAALRALPPGGVAATHESFFLDPLPPGPVPFWDEVAATTAARDVHALVGMPQSLRDDEGPQRINAILDIAPQRVSVYGKERLVPGAEYMGWVSTLGWLYAKAFDGHGQLPAPSSLTQPLFVGTALVGASICHEQSFALTMAERARGSQWLFNASEDAWIPSAMYRGQMRSIARARAMESAKPVLRVSNGAASLLVDAHGRIEQQGPAQGEATLQWTLQPRAGNTPFTRFAPWLTYAPLALLGVLAVGFGLPWRTAHASTT